MQSTTTIAAPPTTRLIDLAGSLFQRAGRPGTQRHAARRLV